MDQDTEVSPVLHMVYEYSGYCLLSSVEQAELSPICGPCVGQVTHTYMCIRACPLRYEERRKTPFSLWDRTKIWWFFSFISGPSLLSTMRFLIKPLHRAHVNCTQQLLPVEYIPVFHLVGNNAQFGHTGVKLCVFIVGELGLLQK